MGRVFVARDTLLGREVALKFLLETSTPEAASRLLREARSASHLNHPGICQVYDVGESEAGPWIAMEYVHGESLEKQIPSGGLPFETTLRLAREITGALDHAHQRGIVHRDLKPANIALSTDGGVKVLDFGLARSAPGNAQDLTTLTAAVVDDAISGTPAYMAPEVIRGNQADARSDLWALGVVLFEMSAGSRPFSGRTSFELISGIVSTRPHSLPASVPEAFAAIVYRLLEKEPAMRYQSAAEVIAALDVLRGGTVPSVTPAVNPPARRRWYLLAAALALLALGLASAVWWTRGEDPLELTGIRPLSGPDIPQTMATFSPDGSQLAFVAPDAEGVPQVWVRTISERQPVQITSGSTPAARPRWHPDGGSIVYGLRGAGIWTVPPFAGGVPRRIVESGTNPNLSRNGEWLTWEEDRDIWVAGTDGSNARRVSGVPRLYYSVPRLPSLSPDGSRIVFFQAALGPNGDFWTIPSNGGTAERLTSDLRPGGASVWTPDGERIVFSSGRAGANALWQLTLGAGDPEPLTTGAGDDDWPDISADGSRIVFTNVRNSWDLRVMDDTGRERTLLRRPTGILFPRFSPDGSRIAMFGPSEFAVAITTIGADGSDERQLTGGRELNHMPRWSSDGESVVFYQNAPEVGLRSIPAVGGVETAVLPFEWQAQNAVEFAPDGKHIVYTRQGSNPEQEATLIRDLATGQERALTPHLHYARFSRDGNWIAGTRHDSRVVVCSVGDLRCQPVGTTDWLSTVAWSGDDSRVYFLRGATRTATQELWSVGVVSRDERKHAEIGPFRGIDRYFDVSPAGEIVWAPFTAGRSELWAAMIR